MYVNLEMNMLIIIGKYKSSTEVRQTVRNGTSKKDVLEV